VEAGLMKKIILSVEAGLLDYLMILSVPFFPLPFCPNTVQPNDTQEWLLYLWQ